MKIVVLIVLSIFLVLGLAILIGIPLYEKLGLFKWFYHDMLHWHEPDQNKEMSWHGINLHATCKYCGKEIIQDSQGNWF
jgi:hypothetical protein